MNANQLAEYLEKTLGFQDAAIKVLQQEAELTLLRESKKEDVAEIYKLKAEIEALIFDINTYVRINTEMLNEMESLKAEIESLKSGGEPVAYVNLNRWKVCNNADDCFSKTREEDGDVAVYTHPPKTLSDEEIMTITEPMFVLGDKKMICDFARAILKKAGEK
jgi:hypothetical protein